MLQLSANHTIVCSREGLCAHTTGAYKPLLDMTRRPEQSAFVAGRSTMDAILALRLLSDLHREFDRPLNGILGHQSRFRLR